MKATGEFMNVKEKFSLRFRCYMQTRHLISGTQRGTQVYLNFMFNSTVRNDANAPGLESSHFRDGVSTPASVAERHRRCRWPRGEGVLLMSSSGNGVPLVTKQIVFNLQEKYTQVSLLNIDTKS